jgi:hypothetical protein
MTAVATILTENDARNAAIVARFNPITGEGSIGKRTRVEIEDYPTPVMWLPDAMLRVPLIRQILKAGSIKAFFKEIAPDLPYTQDEKEKIIEEVIRVRIRYDFPFWAAMFVFIKAKGGGEDILFRLNRPQRKLVRRLMKMLEARKPIRLVLLKARQWGGSTAIQLFMAWMQLVLRKGLNSLIVAHLGVASDEIHDMFDRMIRAYPVKMLHALGDAYTDNEPKFVGVGRSGNIHRVPQRNCKIKIGTAERPDSARGGDYNLVHCSEVGLWKLTEKKTPEEIVRSACSGVLYRPYTLIVYESTPNGTGNFFHREYLAAKAGKSQFEALFVSWFEIEQYALPFDTDKQREQFAQQLYDNRLSTSVTSDREEPGTYLWWLWQQGATLEAIHWYVAERSKYTNHADMASEYPSDDIEAFTFSGRTVFAEADVKQFRAACRPPKMVGEIYGCEETGEQALEKLRFTPEPNGRLAIWQNVERDDTEEITDRYLVVVDVCKGHTKTADYAVIAVFDRLYMIDGERPAIVAQWYGHIDMDLLAWKATQIAEYYCHALLVIESNTLETNNTKGEAEYILNQIREVYDNLYARKQSAEDIREGIPRKYGFHTNVLTKKVVIHNLKTVLREHLYTERDEGCLDEYLTYVETEKGGYEAKEGYHDDKLMTRAIGLHICFNEMPMPTIVKHNQTKPKRKKAVSAATI